MKKVLCLMALLSLSVVNMSTSSAASQDQLRKVCATAKAGNVANFKKAVKQTKVRLHTLYESMKCNELSLLGFAMANGDSPAISYLIKKVKRRDLAVIAGISSIDWFIEHGYEDTEAYAILQKRLN